MLLVMNAALSVRLKFDLMSEFGGGSADIQDKCLGFPFHPVIGRKVGLDGCSGDGIF